VARKQKITPDTIMISRFFAYVQYQLGAQYDDAGKAVLDTSWSAQLQGSERVWMMLEGVHVLTLMLFVGSILFVDLRLLGVVFRNRPVSKVADSILPYTVGGFVAILATGLPLFFANAFEYYHSVIFRIKVVLLFAAAINIFIFHYRIQANRAVWDNAVRPPVKARIAAGTSIALWAAVILAGRFMAYDWFSCENASGLIAAAEQCNVREATLASIEPELAQ
jgi:hypothetical protein